MEKVVNDTVHWLREQVNHAHVNGLIVGVSGGLDSAVVANLIKRAFPNNSLGVIMPLKSNPTDIDHAMKVVKACNVNYMTIDLTKTHQIMYEEIKGALPDGEEWNANTDRIADANLRARLRMGTLYTLATNYKYLVAGTDNAAEWYTGYFTKYGDGGVDIQPIIDLTKGEVREMAAFLNVPTEVIEKKPSADLWAGQTDEEEMGTSYDMIDNYLLGKEIPEHDRHLIERMNRTTEHKRQIATQYRFK